MRQFQAKIFVTILLTKKINKKINIKQKNFINKKNSYYQKRGARRLVEPGQ